MNRQAFIKLQRDASAIHEQFVHACTSTPIFSLERDPSMCVTKGFLSPTCFLMARTHCNYCSINLRINYSFLFPEIRGILHMRKRGFYFPLAAVYCAACYCICHLISNLNIGKSPAAMRHDLRFWPVTIMSAYKTIDIAVDSAY